MKTLLLLLLPFAMFAQVNPHYTIVHSYHKRDGTAVQSYRRTAPNRNTRDNYSHKGNTNPYTGYKGYKK